MVSLKMCLNVVSGGSVPDPVGEAYNALPDLLVGWRGEHSLPIPLPSRCLELGGALNTRRWSRADSKFGK